MLEAEVNLREKPWSGRCCAGVWSSEGRRELISRSRAGQ